MNIKEIIRLLKYAKTERWRFIVAIILMLFEVGLNVFLPYMEKMVIDKLEMQSIVMKVVIFLIVGFLTLSAVNQVVLYFESMLLIRAGQGIVYELRKEVFSHIEQFSQNQFNNMPVGYLVTRVTSYTNSVSEFFSSTIIQLFSNILLFVGIYAMMFIMSWKLALILSIFVALVFIISIIFRRKISKIFDDEKNYISNLNIYLSENLGAMKLIQLFNIQNKKREEFKKQNEKIGNTRYKIFLGFTLYRPLINLIYYITIAAVFYFGIKFNFTGGEIVAFYLYLGRFFEPIENIADQIKVIQDAFSSIHKLFAIMDTKIEIRDKEDAIEIDKVEGKIEFKNVYFSYSNDENYVLKNVSFVINPKESCAFVGATGSGKTTILSLIARNIEPQKGEILLDGINIQNIKIKSLRKVLGQMLQDVFLFSGTIRDNITLFDNQDFTDDEIMDVARYTNVDKLIESSPNKLDEQIIEKGENFSNGERQLISFARTVLAKPQIIILDEATSNIDSETEVLIQNSLEKIKNIGTMIMVAHRLSTIQNANQIIVLNKGEIIEKGSHQSLLKLHGYYYKLYQIQRQKQLI
ncbi:MAG: ABC transporter ATP-binding protein/permease [Clostridia bacterium]|nr:ABC transporter ATP-binding protein/permease [Clostridia bacterium]